jgi:isoleucyl-tRNA synthetase
MNIKKHYPEVDPNPNFPAIEERVLKYWQENSTFKQSIDNRDNKEEFIFYDGPPFANGLPHYGHLLTGFVKDAVARFQAMKGKKVERRFGWDCHGLPAELSAEKELKISGRNAVINLGVDKFNDRCRSDVMKFAHEWEYYVNRQARWVDFVNDYKTMDISYMESVLWVFKQLYEKGLVYQAMRVMPYSWACETPLSNFETRLDNAYREVSDKALTFSFCLKEIPDFVKEKVTSCKVIAWTTAIWTIPLNLAIAVARDVEYTYVIKNDECYILAKQAVARYTKEFGEEASNVIFKGNELVGLEYEPIFPYFKNHENAFKILDGGFVTADDGTGLVSLAPAFGEDDQIVCEANNIKLVCPVDDSGKYTKEVTDYKGMLVFDAIDEIIKRIKEEKQWVKTEQYKHNYPHCWRTDTPLIYRAVPSWYVKVTAIKDRMVELNQQINWIPGYVKNGSFGKWLENARDWSISRNRFWGTPIPIWISDDPKYPRIDVYGSISELEKDFNVKITDLHKPFIDNLIRPNPDDPNGKAMMRRVPDVFDCWFDSGSMPYGQLHYPFENKDKFEKNFPADFIVEYTAQTRGWFYTLMILSTALFDKTPFLNCICHGVILDSNGEKLSKRLKNYADPKEMFNLYGSDAMRFLMLSSPVLRGQELLIDKHGDMIKDVLRLSIKPIWNAYNFFTLYANSDEIKAEFSFDSSNILDQYILAKVKYVVENIEKSLNGYDLPSACKNVDELFEVLNNWYIRRNRHRFWKSEIDQDKQSAYNTLYTILILMCKAAAPLLPLVLEEVYLSLTSAQESLHIQDFPQVDSIKENKNLVEIMDKVRDICSTALSIRNKENIRIRQPLKELSVFGKNLSNLAEFKEIIKDELNVREVQFSENIEDKASLKLKINFQVLGKRLPAKIKDIIAANKSNQWQKSSNGKIEIAGEILQEGEYELLLEALDNKGSNPLSSQDGLIILDLTLNEELVNEGIARDLVRIIQQARRDANLRVSDKISLFIEASDDLINSLHGFIDYINEQTLASTSFSKVDDNSFITTAQLNNCEIKIGFRIQSGKK